MDLEIRNRTTILAETEQAAFHIWPYRACILMSVTSKRCFRGGLFSYTDTQVAAPGRPNFNELPIQTAPCVRSHNNQRDARPASGQTINKGQASLRAERDRWWAGTEGRPRRHRSGAV